MKTRLIILLIISVAIIFAGCSDRGVNENNMPDIKEGGITTTEGSAVFDSYFPMQINNTYRQFNFTAYQPRVAFPPLYEGDLQAVPVVFLFAPQDGNSDYYFRHGLKEIADEMIATGEIQPMSIVCLANDDVFGGYFYANNRPAAGFYDDFFAEKLIDQVYNAFLFETEDTSVLKPGVGGIGMGSYGAMRMALLNPGMFNAISITDGPLDFDGSDGNSGLMTLFDDVLTEQGIMGSPTWQNDFDTSGGWRTSRLFVGGGFAFSPHDTAIDYYDTIILNTSTTEDPSDLIKIPMIQTRYVIDNPESLIPNVVSGSPDDVVSANSKNYDFHLPFDGNGVVNTTIWDFWLEQNLETLLGNNPTALANTDIWIAHSDEFVFGNYGTQTASFISTLQGNSNPVNVFNYSGYGDRPADNGQYVHDLIRQMLIFHSESFGN